MICPECQGTVDEIANACSHCGVSLISPIGCAVCQSANMPASKFCDQCGNRLAEGEMTPPTSARETVTSVTIKSERKHVTVLFSDICRYREMISRVDPEDMREVTHHIFSEMVRIIVRYEGHVDRILWDGVLAVFGMPQSHEDDVIRGIRSAREIQRMVSRLGIRYVDRVEGMLAMRSGVATGLVVTGSTKEDTGRHGITGDTVNLAARLRDMALPGEVLVDNNAFSAAAGYFSFKAQGPVTVKGRMRPVLAYRVQSTTPQPDKVHRTHGLKARIIGRDRQLKQLEDAAHQLRRKEGRLLVVTGDAGTGKSRLIAEFRAIQSAEATRWVDGHGYSYNQGIPYFPFIDMLDRLFGIHEEDTAEAIKKKLWTGIRPLVDDPETMIPYLTDLYAVPHPEARVVGPEVWKSCLHSAFLTLISALSAQTPTIVCIEDLHWADPSSLSLIRFILNQPARPILFVISYRPPMDFFAHDPNGPFSYVYETIRLEDLDTRSARGMVRSLMDTDNIPETLDRYILKHVEGNPFYIEEVVNSLIDAKRLRRIDRLWDLDSNFDISDLSSTINGIVHGRLDHLGNAVKTIAQEASVIGRVFRLGLLERITVIPDQLKSSIQILDHVGLIGKDRVQASDQCSFKHSIVQEVIYKGLLKKDRRIIHEKVARTLETLFASRLDGVLETLALHYANSNCTVKAAEYLIRSGEKSLEKYAVEESHRYYERAYRLLSQIPAPSVEEQAMLIDLLIKWYFAFNKKGRFSEILDLLRSHEAMVRTFDDPLRTGMYEMCLGWALQRREQVSESFSYLTRALKSGQRLADDKLVAYSSACLCWTCTDLGRMDEALVYGQQAAEVVGRMKADHELVRFNLTGLGLLHLLRGNLKACWKTGERLIRYGEQVGDIRTFSEGYLLLGSTRMAAGDLIQADSLLNTAIEVSVDPIYSLNARFFLSYAYFAQGKVALAARTLESVIDDTERFGYEYVGTSAKAFYGIILATMGHLEKGVTMIRKQIQSHQKRGKKNHHLIFTHMLGKFYLSLALRKGAVGFTDIFKNTAFLVRTLPVASRLAERYLRDALEIAEQIGARLRLAQASFDLGLLQNSKKRFNDARECISRSIELFDQCGADMLLKEARSVLDNLPR